MSQYDACLEIAVIGAGVSGLVTAYKLGRWHNVALFESQNYLGGHTNTVDVCIGREHQAIDTGFIVFNDRTYPKFTELLNELEVRSRKTTMGFSLRCDSTGLEYNGGSLNGLFAQRGNLIRPKFLRILRDLLRFNREAVAMAVRGGWADCSDETTVEEFVNHGGYSHEFIKYYLLPMGSAIWSCPPGKLIKFPIRFLVEFYHNHGLLSLRDRPTWHVIEGGSRTYVRALLRRFQGRVYTDTPIERVRRFDDRVEVFPRQGTVQVFDHVVLACHADQALKILADPTQSERELLASFPYERNVAMLHTDPSLLPRRRRAWASWNYRLPALDTAATVNRNAIRHPFRREKPALSNDVVASRTVVTYCMNILQHVQSGHVFNLTLNGEALVDPAKVLHRMVYEHPVFTSRRAAAQARHCELIGVNRTSYCGAYWGNGFHEDGVVSALAVCERLAGQNRQTSGRNRVPCEHKAKQSRLTSAN